MKLLCKRAFKSLFRNKIFTVLIIIIVFLSGTMFTMTNSAAESFSKSFNQVVSEGALHDYVIKENFKVSPDSKLVMGLGANGNQVIDKDNVVSNIQSTSTSTKKLVVRVDANATLGDYVSTQQTYDDWRYDLSFEVNETDPQDIRYIVGTNSMSIDDFVVYLNDEVKKHKSQITNTVQSRLSTTFIEKIDGIYSNQIDIKNTKSLSVSVNDNSYKLVQVDTANDKVNKMIIYDGSKNYLKPLTREQMDDLLKNEIMDNGFDESTFTFNHLKGYKATAQSIAGTSFIVDDPSAYQAIISPGYANANKKVSVSVNTLVEEHTKFQKDSEAKELYKTFINHPEVQAKYKDSLVWVDKTPYFVIGIGTTPDFSYPIIDESHPTVDVKSQAILFVNNRGHERAFDAWRTNPVENYGSFKFKAGVSENKKTEIVNEIEYIAKNGKTSDGSITNIPKSYFPDNIKIVTSAWDIDDQLMLTQERIVFLDQIENLVMSLSIATTTLLVIFVTAIIILVFSVIIKMSRKSLATLMSLGFSRHKIALSNSLIAFFVGGMPAIVGYLTGFGLQYAFIGEFDAFWTIPTYGDPFSLVSLMITFLLPFVMLGVLIYVITYGTLRHPIESMIRDTVKENGDWIGNMVSSLKVLTISGKYAIALMIKNIGKLALTTVTMMIALTSLTTGFSTNGVANEAYRKTSEMYNYEYQINLYSPTTEGGKYVRINDLNALANVETRNTYVPGGAANVDTKQPHWHIPSEGDASYGLVNTAMQPSNLEHASVYLDNKIQWQPLLDVEVAGLNPWGIAERLMPDNQVNIAYENRDEFYDKSSLSDSNATVTEKVTKLKELLNEEPNDYVPYAITYRNVVTDKDDELYTYIESEFIAHGKANKYNIIGLSDETKMVDIDSNKIKSLTYNPVTKTIPVLINKFISESLSLDKGSVVSASVKNKTDRNFVTPSASDDYKIEIAGVIEGYDNNGIYTAQRIANEVIGLDNSSTSFNGVFTKNASSTLLRTMPLYSPSGLYIGIDTIIEEWEVFLERALNNENIWAYGDSITNDTSKFIELYSRTPYVASLSSVYWSQMTRMAFKSTSELSSTIIAVVMFTSISLSIIFTVIVASLMLTSNRKRIATLSTMGYSKSRISKIYMYTYIIPTLVAIAFAIPLSIGLLAALRVFIIHFGKILIPFALNWWAPLVAILLVSSIFVITTLVSIYSQRHDMALKAFKED